MNNHLKALDAVLLYVQDPTASAKFYETLGFSIDATPSGMKLAKLGEFAIELMDMATAIFQQDVPREPKGAGVFLFVKVEDIDGYYQELIGQGLKPSSRPTDYPWGDREFAIKDPDGYKMVFYQAVK